jgi:enoyl-CoA hydratase/carnithine racemase
MDLESYATKYDNFKLERTAAGILTVTLHTDGKSHVHTGKAHRDFPDVFADIARDPENQVVILTGAGDSWITRIDFSTVGDITRPEGWHRILDEARRTLWAILDVPVPMISAINGPAPIHGEYALLADIILAADTTYFQDNQHLPVGHGVVPADGVQLIYPEALGRIRGHYFLLTGQKIDALDALRLGLVNEVLPPAKLMDRAKEHAEKLVKLNPLTRRYTRLMFTKRMKRLVIENLPFDMGLEGLSIASSLRT